MFCIVLADRPNGSCKRTFFESWSQSGKMWIHLPCVLIWTANLHTLHINNAIAPPLDLLAPQRLMTTTTTVVDYGLVFVLQKILSLLGIQVFGEFQAPPIGLEYELKHVKAFTMDPFGCKYSLNDAKEDGGKMDVLLCADMALTGLPRWNSLERK